MGLSHVLADEECRMGQPYDDVALAIGEQDRGGRRQVALLEVVGEPGQVQAGKYDTSDKAVVVLEALGKMDHPLTIGRIHPIIPDGEPRLSHSTLKEALARHRRIRCPLAARKEPPGR